MGWKEMRREGEREKEEKKLLPREKTGFKLIWFIFPIISFELII